MTLSGYWIEKPLLWNSVSRLNMVISLISWGVDCRWCSESKGEEAMLKHLARWAPITQFFNAGEMGPLSMAWNFHGFAWGEITLLIGVPCHSIYNKKSAPPRRPGPPCSTMILMIHPCRGAPGVGRSALLQVGNSAACHWGGHEMGPIFLGGDQTMQRCGKNRLVEGFPMEIYNAWCGLVIHHDPCDSTKADK